MKKNKRISCIIMSVIIVSAVMFLTTEYWGRGIIYPRFTYSLQPADRTQETELTLWTSRGINPFESEFNFTILAWSVPEKIRISSLAFSHDGKSREIAGNRELEIRESGWKRTGNGMYLNTNAVTDRPKICWSRYFKGKKKGDTFPLRLTLVYSLDNGPERRAVLDYTVTVTDYFYVHPLVF